MLRWMCEHTRRDGIRNEDICDEVGVVSVEDKMRKVRLDGSDMLLVEYHVVWYSLVASTLV
ncbi:hypothetical protein H5410_020611 [Solanum commersonii]|uniref:Uncharacterized protein n=1 Tax=Solanum commersonii TaxID=4109 RepID=A0A9J5Z9K9_SOLCO|nr:hypothetical protein H5410_020611 [Solanum commersonii]